MLLLIFCIFVAVVKCEIISVADNKSFVSALASVQPGDTIQLTDGYYHGDFEATISGRDDAVITLEGSRNAIVTGYKYSFWLLADYWILRGFSAADTLKGIVVEGGSFNLIDSIEVYNTGQEGIHLRYNSSDNIIQNCSIHDTGTRSQNDQGFGEGIYIGQAVSNWIDGPDKSDRNQVLNNKIGPNVTAECVDIKEGSCCGVISRNTFIGPQSGVNYADSWVDIKGEDYLLEDNTGTDPLLDGFQIHYVTNAGMGGCNNTVRNNRCNGVPEGGKCVADSSGCENTIENNLTG